MDRPSGGKRQDSPSGQTDWAAALSEHDRWLRTVAWSRLGEWEAVEEVMQEVGLAVAKQNEKSGQPKKIGPWLYGITVRQCLMYRRRQGRKRKLIDRYALQRPADSEGSVEPDPLDWLMAQERGSLIREAIAALKGKDSEILLLKYSEGWSYREIAKHLGISEGAVDARLHRARGRFRAELARRQVFEGESDTPAKARIANQRIGSAEVSTSSEVTR